MSRQQDDTRIRGLAAKLCSYLDAIQVGHLQVKNGDMWTVECASPDRFPAIRNSSHDLDVGFEGEQSTNCVPK